MHCLAQASLYKARALYMHTPDSKVTSTGSDKHERLRSTQLSNQICCKYALNSIVNSCVGGMPGGTKPPDSTPRTWHVIH